MKLFIGTGLDAGLRQTGSLTRPDLRPPAPLRAPTLLGAGRVGAPLTVDPGVWSGAVAFAFVWLRNGGEIPGAAAAIYAPGQADARAALVCRVTAMNAAGRTTRDTPPITIAFPPPVLVGAPPDIDYTQLTGPHIVDVSPFFSGSSLSFIIKGDGVDIDPSTGRVTLGAASLLSGVAVHVTAANSGGRTEASFNIKVIPAAKPVLRAAPALTGTGRVDAALHVEPGLWDGEPDPELALQWLCDGAPIAGATGRDFTPSASEDATLVACRVTARNASGEAIAETEAVRVAYAAPVMTGLYADVVFAMGTGARDVPMAAFFSGNGLRFSVTGAAAEIDPATGIVAIPTATARMAEIVTVTAANSGGTAEVRFAVTVMAAPEAPAAPEPIAFAQGTSSATVSLGAFFGGADLVYALVAAPAGVTVDAGTGLVTIPTSAPLAGEIVARATNAVGAATQRFDVRVLAAAVAVGAPAPVAFAQGAASATVSLGVFFGGADLVYALEAAPAGVTINAGTGLVTVPTSAPLAVTVVVRGTNAVASAVQSIPVRVLAAPASIDAAGAVVYPQGAGTRALAAQGFFSGPELSYALVAAPAGVTVAADTGLVTIPTATALAGVVVVRASNAVGAATVIFALEVQTAPRGVGTPEALGFVRAAGSRTVSTQGFFAGADLVYALDAAPAGVAVNSGSGLVTIPTATAFQGTIRVRATNVAGSVTQNFAVTVGASSQTPAAVTPAAPQDGDWTLDQITVQK